MVISPDFDNPKYIAISNTTALEKKYFNAYKSFNHISNARGSKIISNKKVSFSNVSKTDLYNIYWKPIKKALPSNTKKVFISTSGVYNSINLNTLYNATTGKYVIDEVNMNYVSSTRILISKSKSSIQNQANSSIALFGYPLYKMNDSKYKELIYKYGISKSDGKRNGFNNESWELLEGTLDEVNAIQDIFTDQKWRISKYIENNAIEENVKSLNSPYILHIATHGLFIDDNSELDPMLRSGLVFAGINNYASSSPKPNIDDGILTAYEASTLKLDNTELTVLSACETGLGESESGEGVYGLQRAFKIAGSKSILMSLWKVDDEATKKLMVSFYKNWLKSKNRKTAFIKAQKLLKNEYPDPYYWGAFVMID